MKMKIGKIEFQINKNGNGLDTSAVSTIEGELYARSENDGHKWSLLFADSGEHFDGGNSRVTESTLDSIFYFVEKYLLK
jgi:hypothetical protein